MRKKYWTLPKYLQGGPEVTDPFNLLHFEKRIASEPSRILISDFDYANGRLKSRLCQNFMSLSYIFFRDISRQKASRSGRAGYFYCPLYSGDEIWEGIWNQIYLVVLYFYLERLHHVTISHDKARWNRCCQWPV